VERRRGEDDKEERILAHCFLRRSTRTFEIHALKDPKKGVLLWGRHRPQSVQLYPIPIQSSSPSARAATCAPTTGANNDVETRSVRYAEFSYHLPTNGDLAVLAETQVSLFGFGVSLPQSELLFRADNPSPTTTRLRLSLTSVQHTWSTRMFGWLFGLDRIIELLIQSLNIQVIVGPSSAETKTSSAETKTDKLLPGSSSTIVFPVFAQFGFTVPTSSIIASFVSKSVQRLRVMDVIRFFRDLVAALTLDVHHLQHE